MADTLEEKIAGMQARMDEQSRLLQAATEELEQERASRRGDSAGARGEPQSPAINTSDRAQESLLNRFVGLLQLQRRRRSYWNDLVVNIRTTVRATGSPRHLSHG